MLDFEAREAFKAMMFKVVAAVHGGQFRYWEVLDTYNLTLWCIPPPPYIEEQMQYTSGGQHLVNVTVYPEQDNTPHCPSTCINGTVQVSDRVREHVCCNGEFNQRVAV